MLRLRKVSIPNGMEFYLAMRALASSKRRFQFPTGWNSTMSNYFEELITNKFQFPTGWNSTMKNLQDRFRRGVSIPNGMEFYNGDLGEYDLLPLFQFPTGWNSTLPHATNTRRKTLVSIPNGMEFYSTNFAIFLGRKC